MTMTHFSGKGEIKASRVGSENKRARNRFHSEHCMHSSAWGKGESFGLVMGIRRKSGGVGAEKRRGEKGGGRDRVSDGRADPD